MSFANTLKYVFKATSANFGNMLPYTQLSRVFGFTPMVFFFSISLLRRWQKRYFIRGFASSFAELQKLK